MVVFGRQTDQRSPESPITSRFFGFFVGAPSGAIGVPWPQSRLKALLQFFQAMDYATIKIAHQTAVVLSISGFLIRGAASLIGASWINTRLAKTLPHLVDTVLLLSALWLAWTLLRLAPGNAPWIIAKVGGLLVYIILGVIALRAGRPKAVRIAAWLGALVTAGWIVSVALAKNPAGFLSFLNIF